MKERRIYISHYLKTTFSLGRVRLRQKQYWVWLRIPISIIGSTVCPWGQSAQVFAETATSANLAPNIYSQWVQSSQYITVRDGTRLAIDIFQPARDGRAVEGKSPVILMATPYHRARYTNGTVRTILDDVDGRPSTYKVLLAHGYVVASLDMRGHGASFGHVYGGGVEQEENRFDLYDAVEWLAAQPWSDGVVGMHGCSAPGNAAMFAASVMPPHLKAISASSSGFDAWGVMRVNGVRQTAFLRGWDDQLRRFDTEDPTPPVDEDKMGDLRDAAMKEHRTTWDAGLAGITIARDQRPYRNTVPSRPELAAPAAEAWNYLNNFRITKLPVLHFAGWRDMNIDGSLIWYRSLAAEGVPQKLIIGPWYHCEWENSDVSDVFNTEAEYTAWYDHWLNGKNNGAVKDPPILYYVTGAPKGHEWRSAGAWPLPGSTPTPFYLGGRGGGGEGTLLRSPPTAASEPDRYTVDYSVTTDGLATRFRFPVRGPNLGLRPIDMAQIDAKSVVYTSAPLSRNMEVTGYPLATLWVSSTAPDADFFVYLEEVDQSGRSKLLTEGMIRASNRATRSAPFDNQDLPWHPGYARDQAPLEPGVPVRLEFAFFPMSNFIAKGNRLRLSVSNFDKGGWDTPVIEPAPTISLHHSGDYRSAITLPVVVAK